jgi:hypothetical protein
VHAIRFVGGHPGPLITAVRQLELPFDPGSTVTVEIAEADSGGPAPDALVIQAQVERVPAPRVAPPPAQAAPRPLGRTPDLEQARPLQMHPARVPGEFGARLHGVHPALRLCLDRHGQVDSVRFLEQAHPRLAASVLDMLRDAEHAPYRVGDRAVPSCQTRGRS